MAIFKKISTGMQMDGCNLYNYLLTLKGFCCERGWTWEDETTGIKKTGRDWRKYWQLYGNPCSNQNVPVNKVPPVIVNPQNGIIGGVLSISSVGTWASDTGILGYEYQWQRNGVDIIGETGATYTILTGDVDKYITVKVRAQDSDGWSLWAVSNSFLIPLFWGVSGGIWGVATNNIYA